MESFIKFIQQYWQFISAGILLFVEVLILILKKRPQTFDDFTHAVDEVVKELPKIISCYEVPGHGDEKKSEVIEMAYKYLFSILNRDLCVREDSYFKEVISKQIELILSTPQKKGVR